MRSTLLSLMLLGCAGFVQAHSVDPWTIEYDISEIVDPTAGHTTGWDPNGNVPPQPEAPYYVNPLNADGKTYYRFEKVSDSPLKYETFMPVMKGDFRIYAKEYWTNRGTSNWPNAYLWGAKSQPTGVKMGEKKNLGQPGEGNMQIEGGGIWYGTTVSFYPSGSDGDTTPYIIMTGGSHEQHLELDAAGEAVSVTSGIVNFQIKAGGVYKPAEQTYTVTCTYTDADGASQTLTQTVKGLEGKFEVENLKMSATTDFSLTVSASVPTISDFNQSSPGQIKDMSATASTSITTFSIPYLVGEIVSMNDDASYATCSGTTWLPAKAIEGTQYSLEEPDYYGSESMYVWRALKMRENMRFRFITKPDASWTVVNTSPQYYPAEKTTSLHYLGEDDQGHSEGNANWGPYLTSQAGTGVDNAWQPYSYISDKANAENYYYTIFLDLRRKVVGIKWHTSPTGIDDIAAESTATDSPKIVDVVNLQGIVLRHNVSSDHAADDLPAGLYIIGGKKIAVR